jgi:hypothetical protein
MAIPEPATWRECPGQGLLLTNVNHMEQRAVLHTLLSRFERACHAWRTETALHREHVGKDTAGAWAQVVWQEYFQTVIEERDDCKDLCRVT